MTGFACINDGIASGFHITYENGITVSVMFGKANYCENRNKNPTGEIIESKNAEVAIFGINDKCDTELLNRIVLNILGRENRNNVIGWLNPEEVTKILAYVSELPKMR